MVHGLTLGGTRLSRMVVIRQRVKMVEHLTTIPTAVNRESPLFFPCSAACIVPAIFHAFLTLYFLSSLQSSVR